MKFLKKYYQVYLLCLAIFTVSLSAVLLFWAILPANLQKNESSDYITFYEPVARNLLAGKGFTHADGTVATRYPPGYPLILAGVFGLLKWANIPENIGISAFILLCMALTSVIVFKLVRAVLGSIPGLITALVWITYPLTLWIMKQPNCEILFMVVLYVCVYVFLHTLLHKDHSWLSHLLLGILVGVSMLIRPIAVGMGMIFVVLLYLFRRDFIPRARLFLSMMILVGNFLVVFPWEAWVYARTGQIIMLSTGGVPSILDGLTFAANPKEWRQHIDVPPDVRDLTKEFWYRSRIDKSLHNVIVILSKEMRDHPLTVLKLLGLKVIRSWYATDSCRFDIYVLLIQIPYLFLIAVGSIIAWKRNDISRPFIMSIWCIVIYFWIMTTLVLSIVRYMVPVIGLLFPFLTLCIKWLIETYRKRLGNL